MQAYSQSSRAARNPLQSKVSSSTSSRSGLQTVLDRPAPKNYRHATDVAEGIGLAHDNGNILAALGLYCDLLARPGVLRNEHQHYVAELRVIAERSTALMRNLLINFPASSDVLLSSDYDDAAIAFPAADPAVKLREIAPLLTAIAAPSAIVTVKTPRSLPPLTFPSENLERIIVNLIRNAAQAIEFANSSDRRFEDREPGHIRVTLATIAGHLHLTVEDNGPGMPVATAAAFLSPAALTKGVQRGLGHHIVHQLVSSSGGTLGVRVRPGRGTTFCIKWPVPDAPRPSGRNAARRDMGVAA